MFSGESNSLYLYFGPCRRITVVQGMLSVDHYENFEPSPLSCYELYHSSVNVFILVISKSEGPLSNLVQMGLLSSNLLTNYILYNYIDRQATLHEEKMRGDLLLSCEISRTPELLLKVSHSYKMHHSEIILTIDPRGLLT